MVLLIVISSMYSIQCAHTTRYSLLDILHWLFVV